MQETALDHPTLAEKKQLLLRLLQYLTRSTTASRAFELRYLLQLTTAESQPNTWLLQLITAESWQREFVNLHTTSNYSRPQGSSQSPRKAGWNLSRLRFWGEKTDGPELSQFPNGV